MSRGLEALQFGPDERLFGLRSESAAQPRQTAIVICQSWGAEGMRCYRGLHLLAQQLANRGFETLRFDYTGTGDSADANPSVAVWLDDIRAAAAELRTLSGAQRVALLGLRLGALLASQAAESARADEVLLWDAPESGQAWMQEMLALDRAHFERKNRTRPQALQLALPENELLGSPWPPELKESIASLRVNSSGKQRRFASVDQPSKSAQTLPDAAQWTNPQRLDAPWVPIASIAALCDILTRELP